MKFVACFEHQMYFLLMPHNSLYSTGKIHHFKPSLSELFKSTDTNINLYSIDILVYVDLITSCTGVSGNGRESPETYH